MAPDDLATFIRTVDFAAIKHKNQKRKDPESTPYINHPIGVARILIEAGVRDVEVLQAAILHDTIEDTETTYEELELNFGSKVASIVLECTDDKNLEKAERKRLQVVNAPKKSDQAKMVKMADKSYNLRDLQRALPVGWTDQRAKEYFAWGKQVTDGCRGVNALLEEGLDKIYQQGHLLNKSG